MKSKIMMLAFVLVALSIAAPVYGATCTSFNSASLTLASFESASGGSCTVGSGATFSNFQVSGAYGSSAASSNIGITFTDLGNALVGVTFNAPNNGTNAAFSVSYDATANSPAFLIGYNDSATPSSFTSYTYTITGVSNSNCVNGSGAGCTGSLNNVTTTVTNAASYIPSNVSANQSTTLDFTIGVPNTGTPEPTSLILFGSGFLAVGLAARRRKGRS